MAEETYNTLETVATQEISSNDSIINSLKNDLQSNLQIVNSIQEVDLNNTNNISNLFNDVKANITNSLSTINSLEVTSTTDSSLLNELKTDLTNNLNTINSLEASSITDTSTISDALKQQLDKTAATLTSLETPKPNLSNITLNDNGTFSFNNKELSNEELTEIFDYTNISDESKRKIIEGIFKSKTVTINGVKYPTKLNENGALVSKDGKTTLKKSKLKKLFGEEGYKALVLKTTKKVTITDNGLKVTDKEKAVKLDLSKKEHLDSTSTKEKKKSNKKKVTSNYTPTMAYVPSSSYTPSNSTATTPTYTANSGYDSYNSSENYGENTTTDNDNSFTFKTQIGNGDVILVDFDALLNELDNLKNLKGKLTNVVTSYTTTINNIATSTSWSGDDKDYFVTQKKSYSNNLSDFETILEEFITALDNYYQNYTKLENELASKTIS